MGTAALVGGGLALGSGLLAGTQKDMAGTARWQPQGSQFMDDQQRAINVLQQRVEGNRPSVAQEQMEQGMDTSLANQVSAVRSSPGLSPALQARLINQAGQEQSTDLARAQSILRAGEQSQAEQNLVGAIGQARGQDQSKEQLYGQGFESAQKRRGQAFGNMMSGLGGAASLAGFGGGGGAG